MSKQILETNYKDDIISESMGGKRRYRLIDNDDGTVSFEDVTEYDQVGNKFGAANVNRICIAINESADSGKIIDDFSAIDSVTQEGYMIGALVGKELKKSVADGKSLIASAITSKGVSTAASASFATMANNIRSISTKPRIRDLGSGYSFNVSGICPNYRELTADNFVVDCSAGVQNAGDGTEDNPNIHWSARFHGFGITKNYNPSTGVFTITNYGSSVSLVEKGLSEKLHTRSFNLTCRVKVVY